MAVHAFNRMLDMGRPPELCPHGLTPNWRRGCCGYTSDPCTTLSVADHLFPSPDSLSLFAKANVCGIQTSI
jgi:hypothetical protein